MNLAFSTHWKKDMPKHLAGKPTHFIEKIWSELVSNINIDLGIDNYASYLSKYKNAFNNDFGYDKFYINPKKHTIRRDEKDRWCSGRNIHFVINARTKNHFQFAPVVQCLSVQKIEIIENCWHKFDDCDLTNPYVIKRPRKDGRGICEIPFLILINGKRISHSDIEQLAINDGFDNVEDFFAWFNTDFEGKIIHWTDLKY